MRRLVDYACKSVEEKAKKSGLKNRFGKLIIDEEFPAEDTDEKSDEMYDESLEEWRIAKSGLNIETTCKRRFPTCGRRFERQRKFSG